MPYTEINFKTKKALKAAVAEGGQIRVYQPGPFASSMPATGQVALEGPHYPEPHRWYASATIENFIIKKVS